MKKPQLPTQLSENLEKIAINRDKASKLIAEVLEKRTKKAKTEAGSNAESTDKPTSQTAHTGETTHDAKANETAPE